MKTATLFLSFIASAIALPHMEQIEFAEWDAKRQTFTPKPWTAPKPSDCKFHKKTESVETILMKNNDSSRTMPRS
jgi:hypothetical protein